MMNLFISDTMKRKLLYSGLIIVLLFILGIKLNLFSPGSKDDVFTQQVRVGDDGDGYVKVYADYDFHESNRGIVKCDTSVILLYEDDYFSVCYEEGMVLVRNNTNKVLENVVITFSSFQFERSIMTPGFWYCETEKLPDEVAILNVTCDVSDRGFIERYYLNDKNIKMIDNYTVKIKKSGLYTFCNYSKEELITGDFKKGDELVLNGRIKSYFLWND